MSRKKHHEAHHEEHMDETWLIPYADLLTLLLALFIVLFASSQVDQKKFEQLASSLNAAFGSGTPAIMDKMQSKPNMDDPAPGADADKQTAKEQAYMAETSQLVQAKKILDQYIQDNGLINQLQAVLTEDGLVIRIKDNAVFPSGSAELLPESRRFASQIAKMLLPLSQKVVVSGHTDNVPINTSAFPSNWDLSAQRAVNFTKFLLAQEKLPPERFAASGFGEFKPLAANDTEEGRSKNRRVEVLILRNYKM